MSLDEEESDEYPDDEESEDEEEEESIFQDVSFNPVSIFPINREIIPVKTCKSCNRKFTCSLKCQFGSKFEGSCFCDPCMGGKGLTFCKTKYYKKGKRKWKQGEKDLV